MNKYYVYAHFRKGENNPFYVGKGSSKRLYQTGNRSVFWKRIVAKYGFDAKILIDNLSEEDSYKMEIECIAMYKLLGFCEANFSLGGDGVRVEKRWWGNEISKSLKGKKTKIGLENKSYKNVITKEELIDLYLNKKMNSIKISKLYGVSYPTICTRLREFGIDKRKCGRKNIPIICLNDGKEFDTIYSAAKYYGVFRENIKKVLTGKYKHTNNLYFIKK